MSIVFSKSNTTINKAVAPAPRIHTGETSTQEAKVKAPSISPGIPTLQMHPNTEEATPVSMHLAMHNNAKQSAIPDIMPEAPEPEASPQEGRDITDEEWQPVHEALTSAINMVQRTTSYITGIHNLMLPGSDPRLQNPRQQQALQMFRIHYPGASASHAFEAQENYGLILEALEQLGHSSFRAVSQEEADTTTDDNTWAYVRGRTATIYLSESILPSTTHEEGYSMTYGALDQNLFARLIIHETSHFRLGVTHRGNNRLRMEDVNCTEGLPIPSAEAALQNAYIYGHFPYCISQL